MTTKAELYDVIRKPIITEKATMASEANAVVFQVAMDATKPMIKEAVEAVGARQEAGAVAKVPLARHARHVAQLSHVLCNRLHVGRQGVFAIPSVGAILEEAEPVLVPPAHKPGSGRDALRRRRVAGRKPHAFSYHPVQIWRVDVGVDVLA